MLTYNLSPQLWPSTHRVPGSCGESRFDWLLNGSELHNSTHEHVRHLLHETGQQKNMTHSCRLSKSGQAAVSSLLFLCNTGKYKVDHMTSLQSLWF